MITTIFVLLTIAITVWYIFKKLSVFTDSDASASSKIKAAIITFSIFSGGIVFSFIQPFTIKRVDAGSVGIVFRLSGNERGISKYELKGGWVVYNSWFSKLYEYQIFQQHVDYPEQPVITKGGFPTIIKPSFNYSLIPGTVGDMFSNLRLPLKEVEQLWLKTAITSSINDVSNSWTVDSIFNHRELFEMSIIAETIKRTGKWFTISQLRTNIMPPDALKESIVQKTKAIQDVMVAESQTKVAAAEALRKIATARGDSAQAVIAASGRAEAIKKEQMQLTPLYIEYLKVKTWNGVNPTTVLSPNSGAIVQLPK